MFSVSVAGAFPQNGAHRPDQTPSPKVADGLSNSNLLLKLVLEGMITLLEEIEEIQTPVDANPALSESVQGAATELIFGYHTLGIDTSLTSSEIQSGIEDANDALTIIALDDGSLDLDQDTIDQLSMTLAEMKNDLQSTN